MNPAEPRKYSYKWAESVVTRLREKYARALTSMEEMLAIDDRVLAKYLAIGDPVFAQLREAVHIIAAWEGSPNFQGWNRINRRMFTLQMSKMGYVRIAGRLDSRLGQRIIEEQGSRGGRGGSEATEPTFLCSSSEETPYGIQYLLFPSPQ